MADTKISDLTAITGADTAADDDFVVVDTSAAQTKRITRDELKAAVLNTGAVTIGGAVSLNAIAETKAVTAVDVFVYDTSLDSDGGAWRDRTQATSWYNETLSTATRGSRKEFPAVAVIVAETAKVTIYDGDDPDLPMWRVEDYTGLTLTSINAIHGSMAVAASTGLILSSYVGDDIGSATLDYTTATTPAIVNNAVNTVTMTVLPNAPIDAATGIQVPTIRVGTDGGISVIENDGTVTSTASALYKESASSSPDYDLWYRHAFGRALLAGTSIYAYMTSSWYLKLTDTDGTAIDNWVVGDVSEGAPVYQKLTKIDFDPTGNKNHMTCGMTANYNSGWMPALIKGAFLSDTDDTDLVGTEFAAATTFDTNVAGVTPFSGATIEHDTGGDGGRLKVISDGTQYSGVFIDYASAIESGKQYLFQLDYTTGTYAGNVNLSANGQNTSPTPSFSTSGTYSGVLTSTYSGTASRQMRIRFNNVPAVGEYFFIDNVTIKELDADRSVNNNGLIANGTITKTAVATGAELVEYSGFSASNYLEQAYNADLDFGTGDFSVMGWFKTTNTTGAIFMRETTFNAGTGYGLYLTAGQIAILAGSVAATTDGVNYSDGVRRHFALVRRSGVAYLYINGVQTYSVARAGTTTDGTATVRIGLRHDDNFPMADASLALIRVSATAPTAEQIAKIYNDERVLFQEGAACTLYGASDAVTALAHDPGTDLLHVGTSAGRSVFQGLRRVSNTTTAVATAISAVNSMIAEE